MRHVRAVAIALLLLTLPLISLTAAAQDSQSVTVNARWRSYVGDTFAASIVTNGISDDGGLLTIVTTPPLVDQSIVAPAGTTCDEATMTCALDGSSDTVIITVRGTLDSAAVDEGQRVQATLLGSGGATSSDESSTKVLPRADLRVLAGGATAKAGESTTFSVVASNAGPSATQAVITLAGASKEVSIEGASDAGCTSRTSAGFAGQLCTLDLPSGDTRVLSFIVTALEGEALPEERTLYALAYPADAKAGLMRVYYSALDPRLHDNSATGTLRVPAPSEKTEDDGDDGAPGAGGSGAGTGSAGAGNGNGNGGAEEPAAGDERNRSPLTLSFTGPTELMQGLTGTYTITAAYGEMPHSRYHRVGGVDRIFVRVEGAGTIASIKSSGAMCHVTESTAASCTLWKAAGTSTTITLHVAGTELGELTLTASHDGGAAAESVSTTITKPATDLVFAEFSASPSDVATGDSVTVKLAVRNDGLASVPQAYVDLPVPDGLDMGDQSRGPCVLSNDNIRCFLGTIAAGATKTVSVSVTADAPGGYSATGIASWDFADTDLSNNQKTLHVTVRAV